MAVGENDPVNGELALVRALVERLLSAGLLAWLDTRLPVSS